MLHVQLLPITPHNSKSSKISVFFDTSRITGLFIRQNCEKQGKCDECVGEMLFNCGCGNWRCATPVSRSTWFRHKMAMTLAARADQSNNQVDEPLPVESAPLAEEDQPDDDHPEVCNILSKILILVTNIMGYLYSCNISQQTLYPSTQILVYVSNPKTPNTYLRISHTSMTTISTTRMLISNLGPKGGTTWCTSQTVSTPISHWVSSC